MVAVFLLRCADVDECAQYLDDCSVEETCRNTAGSFTCTCRKGYRRLSYRKCAGQRRWCIGSQ